MSDIRDEILYNDFGLDTDSSQRYMAKGSADYHLNVLKGEDGWYGELTNLKGNRKVTYQLGTSNVYFVLSSCYDPLTRNVYYWIFSQPYDVSGSGDYEYDNRLVRFNEDTEVIDTIFIDTHNYFGLDPLMPFKDSFVIGDWLYFNPRASEPKMICIEMAYNYTNYDAYDNTLPYVYADKKTYLGGLFMALGTVISGETPSTNPELWERIGDSYQYSTTLEDFDSEFRYAFNVIKRPPVYRPLCSYYKDERIIANNVKNIIFRFAYRYKYFDNSYSVYSAYSDVTLPLYSEYCNGDIADDSSIANYIAIRVVLHSSALVKEVEIVFQRIGSSEGEVWRRAKILNRRDIDLIDQSSTFFFFYNNESYTAIDPIDIEISYDSVPQKANSQEIINKNILCFGGCTEGFNNLPKEDIQVNLTAEIEDLDIIEETSLVKRDNFMKIYFLGWGSGKYINVFRDIKIFHGHTAGYAYYGGYVPAEDWYFYYIDFSWYTAGVLAAGDKWTVTINGMTKTYIITLIDAMSATPLTLLAHLVTFVKTEFIDSFGYIFDFAWTSPTDDPGCWSLRWGDGVIPDITESRFYSSTGTPVSTLTKHRGFKTGSWHPFCLFYYDESLRRWDAQVSKDNVMIDTAWSIDGTTAYVPMLNEYSPLPDTTAHKFNITWEVNHLPPVGAKYWRWGYAGNSLCSSFVQYTINTIRLSAPGAGEPLNTVAIDISPLQTVTNTILGWWNQFSNSIINAYSWTPGDRVRFITKHPLGSDLGDLVDGVYDMEIIKQSADTMFIFVSATDFDYSTLGIGEDSLIEIYTPKRENTERIFYEFGELMPIIEDSSGVLVHGIGGVGIQDQDWSTSIPASGLFTKGDIYHIIRTPSKPINLTQGWFHESAWFSDFFESDDYDRGKIGVETSFNQRYLNIVRYSNQYMQNTLINGLSTFEGNNFKELNDVYGDILRIIENGDTLKVYQRKKPSSILIGRTEYTDDSGNPTTVAVSNRILGSIRYSSTNYGTEFPESISRNNRYIYGFDIYNGVFWRDSANGIFPISGRYESTDGGGSYLMETYFKQKAKALLISGVVNTSVLTVWDERHKNLYVIFKDFANDDNDDTVMFHEPSNRWICFTNMDQTPADGWNEILELDYWKLLGFEGGIGYTFDEDSRFAVFDIVTQTGIEDYLAGTLIVDEDGITYIISEDGSEYLIE